MGLQTTVWKDIQMHMAHHRSIGMQSQGMSFSWMEVRFYGHLRNRNLLHYLCTAESEHVATTYTSKEALWLRQIIRELFGPVTEPTMLYSDSQSAIALTKDGLYHTQTKHIDIWYHFICFVVQNGTINLIYCPTEDMTADMLTKALPNNKAKLFARSLGLHVTWGEYWIWSDSDTIGKEPEWLRGKYINNIFSTRMEHYN